jgi:hypothetical protein
MPKRKRNLFDPSSPEPFPISRAKIECFLKCPRCFYLDRRLGVQPPGMLSMTLNRAVDTLMKAEFDGFRQRQESHPAFLKHGIRAMPLSHSDITVWQSNFKGVKFLHGPTNLLVGGAPDDVLVIGSEWAVLDFKGTSSKDEIVALDTEYRLAYKRQVEVYSWLLTMNGHPVGKRGFLLFANARKDRASFDGRLDFDMQLVEITVDTDWIEPTLESIKACLMADEPPPAAENCGNCGYVAAANGAVNEVISPMAETL